MSAMMSHNLPPIRRIRKACLIEKSGTGMTRCDTAPCRRAFRPDRRSDDAHMEIHERHIGWLLPLL